MSDIRRFNKDILTEIIIKADKRYASVSDLKDVDKRIDDIVSEGGEPNVITGIKVNGETQEVIDKIVDILVPTKVSELDNDAEYQTENEVAATVAEKIAEIVAGAPESLDTLKEIADWIEGHAEDAAAMNSDIKTNAEDIAALKALIGDLPRSTSAKTVIAYIDEAVKSIDLSEYLKASDVEDMTDAEIEAAFEAADEAAQEG